MARTVVIIDDDQDDIEIIAEAIKQIDNSIVAVVFKDAEEAITAMVNKRDILPHYVFIDKNMPCIPGDEILKELRSIPDFDKTKIAIQATHLSSQDAKEHYAAGANFTFEKPLTFGSYIEALGKILLECKEYLKQKTNQG